MGELRPFRLEVEHVECPHCHGTGRRELRRCDYCAGAREVTDDDDRAYREVLASGSGHLWQSLDAPERAPAAEVNATLRRGRAASPGVSPSRVGSPRSLPR